MYVCGPDHSNSQCGEYLIINQYFWDRFFCKFPGRLPYLKSIELEFGEICLFDGKGRAKNELQNPIGIPTGDTFMQRQGCRHKITMPFLLPCAVSLSNVTLRQQHLF